MTTTHKPSGDSPQRGPVDHERREQIVAAADEHFRHYGYGKTTVGDLAKAIGVSSAYVYRFFDSKRSIGEAVCAMTLRRIDEPLLAIAESGSPASERLPKIYDCLVRKGSELFLKERKLHDIVVAAVEESWPSVLRHRQILLDVCLRVLEDGRNGGEFELVTSIEETARAIVATLGPFAHPVLLEQMETEELQVNATAVAALVLRSLRP
jgi:AcrR family transcriptional regulator